MTTNFGSASPGRCCWAFLLLSKVYVLPSPLWCRRFWARSKLISVGSLLAAPLPPLPGPTRDFGLPEAARSRQEPLSPRARAAETSHFLRPSRDFKAPPPWRIPRPRARLARFPNKTREFKERAPNLAKSKFPSGHPGRRVCQNQTVGKIPREQV